MVLWRQGNSWSETPSDNERKRKREYESPSVSMLSVQVPQNSCCRENNFNGCIILSLLCTHAINWYLNSNVYVRDIKTEREEEKRAAVTMWRAGTLACLLFLEFNWIRFWFSISGGKLIWIRISIELNFFSFLIPLCVSWRARHFSLSPYVYLSLEPSFESLDTHADRWNDAEDTTTFCNAIARCNMYSLQFVKLSIVNWTLFASGFQRKASSVFASWKREREKYWSDFISSHHWPLCRRHFWHYQRARLVKRCFLLCEWLQAQNDHELEGHYW